MVQKELENYHGMAALSPDLPLTEQVQEIYVQRVRDDAAERGLQLGMIVPRLLQTPFVEQFQPESVRMFQQYQQYERWRQSRAAEMGSVSGNAGINTVSNNGLNFIVNVERNLYNINHADGYVINIPTTRTDVGWGRDFRVNPLNRPIPTSVTVTEAYEILMEDIRMIENAFIQTFGDGFFEQHQLDALVSLRFNTGALSNFDGLIEYLRAGNYDRNTMRTIFENHYQYVAERYDLGRYFEGWMNRVDRTLDLFFDGNYGHMPIDALTGRVDIN